MTNAQLLRRAESLFNRAQRAHDSYSRARGARKSTGKRIESVRESKARVRSYTLLSEYYAFCTEYGIKAKTINY